MYNIKFLVMDVDGTLTDGKIYMGMEGEILKAFSVKDGYGIKDILPQYKVIPVIITARNSRILENRCKELNIVHVYQGERNKLKKLEEVIDKQGIIDKSYYSLKNVAYIGDDILDLQCMEEVKQAGGIAACPADAVKEVINMADYVCKNNGGDGAVREFIEWLVQ